MHPHDFSEVQRTVLSHQFGICSTSFYWLFTSISCVEFHPFCSRNCLESLEGPNSLPWLFINNTGAAWGNLKDALELPSRELLHHSVTSFLVKVAQVQSAPCLHSVCCSKSIHYLGDANDYMGSSWTTHAIK